MHVASTKPLHALDIMAFPSTSTPPQWSTGTDCAADHNATNVTMATMSTAMSTDMGTAIATAPTPPALVVMAVHPYQQHQRDGGGLPVSPDHSPVHNRR